jgi:integrase
MSVCKRADGTIFVQYVAGGKKCRKYFGRGPGAIDRARDFDLTRERKSESRAGPTFGDIAKAYMDARRITMASSTYTALLYTLYTHILPALGDRYATAITPQIVDKYVSKRIQSVRVSTVRNDVTYIQAILRFGVLRKLIGANPLDGYQRPKSDGRQIMPISTEQLTRLIEVAPEHLRRAILLSYYLGLRPGSVELFSLRWSAVDWSANTIVVTAAKKGGINRREIPISQGLPLRAWYEIDGRPAESTIITYQGRAIASVKQAWQTAKKRAGVGGKMPLYAIRHSFVTSLLHRGVDLKTIASISGHNVSTLLNSYAHHSSASKKAAINILPELQVVSASSEKNGATGNQGGQS